MNGNQGDDPGWEDIEYFPMRALQLFILKNFKIG